jgi:hypothetical protein
MTRVLTPSLKLEDDVPVAASIKVADCGSRPVDHLHIVAYDEHDEPICELIVPEDCVHRMWSVIRKPQ